MGIDSMYTHLYQSISLLPVAGNIPAHPFISILIGWFPLATLRHVLSVHAVSHHITGVVPCTLLTLLYFSASE